MTTLASRLALAAARLLVVAACVVGPTNQVRADNGRCREEVGKDFPLARSPEVGLSAENLLKLSDALDTGKFDIRSLLIVRDCKLVFERYKEGIGREHNHTLYSVTKSITATLVGNLLQQGKLKSVDVFISDVISKPWWLGESDWTKAQRITLRNVMQMSSGLAYRHDPTNNPIYRLDSDRFALALSPQLIAEPGTRFYYSDGDVTLTGAVVAAAGDKNLYSLAKDVLLEPLKMSNYDWWYTDRAGRYPGGWGLRLRPMDMAKVGQLYLQDGEWNGRRIFGPGFRDLAWTPGVDRLYALHWWVSGAHEAKGVRYFFASGFKGQRIYVFPTLRLVAALTASLPGNEERYVTSLIASALGDALDQGDTSNPSATLATLASVQEKGFSGETRVFQEDQDHPRRF